MTCAGLPCPTQLDSETTAWRLSGRPAEFPAPGETIIETCRLNSSHLQLGVPLPGDVYDEHGQMLLAKGQALGSQSQVDKLLERGLYVEISLYEVHFSHITSAAKTIEQKKFDPFLDRRTLKLSLNRLLYGINGGSVKAIQILEFAQGLQDYADTDADAVIAASVLDREEESRAAAQSLSAALLCSLLAKRQGWSAACQRSVVCAALTMNLGMLDLQQRLARQASPLAAAQLDLVHAHPEAAAATLLSIADDDPVWLTAVRQHHERAGGKGYPAQLATPSDESQLLRLVDVFFARARARADRPALTPTQIVREILVEESQGACAALVASLFKLVGIYPPGSFVKLASGEVAVVFRAGESPKTPIAASVTNAAGVPTMQPVRRDTSREIYAIVGTVAPDKVNVGYDLGKLWVTNAKS